MAEEKPVPISLPDFGKLPWDDLYPRLLLAALRKIRRMVWRGEFRGQVPGGRMAHDAVQTAIEKLLAGERRWNWEKSVYENLWGVVSGVIINWGTSAENEDTRIDENERVVQLASRQPGPDREAEWRLMRDQFLAYLRAKGPEVEPMASIMFDQDLKGSKELAKAMGCTTKEIDALKKKLNRLTEAYLEVVE